MDCPETGLPLGDNPPALEFPHFPTRWQVVLWRNWGLLGAARLGAVLQTTPETVSAEAKALGLGAGADQATERLWLTRGYITLIRQNWHLLPYRQLLQLLGWPPERLAYALREDDFLWSKMGRLKPAAAPVAWAPLTAEETRQTAELREIATRLFAPEPGAPRERPFAFLEKYGRVSAGKHPPARHSPFKLKLAYSFSAVYGDPLLDPALDPYPDGLLADLAAAGVNGAWLQGVLYTLVPWAGDSPYSRGHETRIANLNALVEKAARHGIGIYLYLNEPRGMPADFFTDRPDWRGSRYRPNGSYAMCVSNPAVRDALCAGAADLFRKAPGLAGAFTITCSENLTHCQSRYQGNNFPACPRCADKSADNLVAAVNNAIAEGIHSVRPEASVIAWDWAWEPGWAAGVVDQLRPGIKLMCTSEAYMETDMRGIKSRVGDYTISKVGPGFVAEDLWSHARFRGMETLAKVQLNNTWECSAVPYLPVPFLVKAHLRNLEARGISGLMVGWTLGGYPGGNLELVEREPEEIAAERFGPAAPAVIDAWRKFGEAFALFPVHGAMMLYLGPQNYGPMNLLFEKPSGWRPTMVGFPYDGAAQWRGRIYPAEAFEDQFRLLSEGWGAGLAVLEAAAGRIEEKHREAFEDLLSVAGAAYCHFRTTYLQLCFIRLRDEGGGSKKLDPILDEETALARKLLGIMRRDSRVGFEASNHYYYTENALVEKLFNCARLKKIMGGEPRAGHAVAD